jgi:hypothetical protein
MDRSSDEFRHRCEVRWLLSERTRRGQAGKAWLRGYLSNLSRRNRLEKDILTQWALGNRGDHGEWLLG